MPNSARLLRWNRIVALACAVACTAAFLAAPAAAQLITPGAVQDTLTPTKPPPKAPPAQLVFPKPPPPVAHDPNGRRFSVNAFNFVGNTVYSTQALKRLTERYIDLQLNLYDLTRAADIVTRFYQENGYPVARAVLPAQKVENGIVRIEVIEGRVGEVRFEDTRRYSPDYLRWRLTTLRTGELITTTGLEQDLLLLNDMPGLTARAVLEPGKKFGTTDVTIRVQERATSAYLWPNNFGRKEIGQWRLDSGASLNNITGLGDQLNISSTYSEDGLLKYARASYSVPLSARGTKLEVSTSSTDYKLGQTLAPLRITGDSHNTDAVITHPLLRTRGQSLALNVGGRQTKTSQRVLGVETINTRIELFTAGLTYNQIGEDSSVTNASAQLATNFKSNEYALRQDAERLRLDLDFSQLRGVSRSWDAFGRILYSYSPEPLPDTEKFSVGGPGNVRGYRSSEIRGDGGILVTAEARRPFTFAERLGIWSLFYDYGTVRFKALPAIQVDGTMEIQSVGTGVTYYLHQSVTMKLELAIPVGNIPFQSSGNDKGRAWFSLIASF